MKGGLEKKSQVCMFDTCGNKSWSVIRGKVFYLISLLFGRLVVS